MTANNHLNVEIELNSEERARWTEPFMELALRAIRKVHHDHLLWSINQNIDLDTDFSRINMGNGIELADERLVCAAISQELISSRHSTGVYFESSKTKGSENARRYYKLEREVKVPGGKQSIDLISQRMDPADPNGDIYKKSLIEAKRGRKRKARYDGKEAKPGNYQYNAVAIDIFKLIDNRMGFKVNNENPNMYVLVWDAVSYSETEKTAYTFLKEVKEKLITIDSARTSDEGHDRKIGKITLLMRDVKWLPLSWIDPEKDSELLNLNVQSALWLMLVEIKT